VQELLLTVEFAVDLGSGFLLGVVAVPFFCNYELMYCQLIIYFIEFLACFVRVR